MGGRRKEETAMQRSLYGRVAVSSITYPDGGYVCGTLALNEQMRQLLNILLEIQKRLGWIRGNVDRCKHRFEDVGGQVKKFREE